MKKKKAEIREGSSGEKKRYFEDWLESLRHWELKWKDRWKKKEVFDFDLVEQVKNGHEIFYLLDMFPYVSGSSLHLGHARLYVASDIYHRFLVLNKKKVYRPIGWDSFGLPAENFALSHNSPPTIFTRTHIRGFRRQMKKLGLAYDFASEINTSDPEYFAVTQRMFVDFFFSGLAEERLVKVNWCEELKTVLADEEVKISKTGLKLSERGGFLVTQKKVRHWAFKLTSFASELDKGIDKLYWPKKLGSAQKEWIGLRRVNFFNLQVFWQQGLVRSVSFPISILSENSSLELSLEKQWVVVLSPDLFSRFQGISLEICLKILTEKNFWVVGKIVEESRGTIPVVVMPFTPLLRNVDSFPILIDVLSDNKLIRFSQQNFLFLKQRVNNSCFIQPVIFHHLTLSKLKDWVFSRQRYWGEPIPLIKDFKTQSWFPETNLPLRLPDYYQVFPLSGERSFPPLARADLWVHLEKNGRKFVRETNVMPQWAGSCWYYLGYLLKKISCGRSLYPLFYSEEFKKILQRVRVSFYFGGAEYATSHYLYTRFWHLFLFNQGLVNYPEPFQKIYCHGLVLGADGRKMSKSLGNVVLLDEVLSSYSADVLRLALMFRAPLKGSMTWNMKDLDSMARWLKRVDTLINFWLVSLKQKNSFVSPVSLQKIEKSFSRFVDQTAVFYRDLLFNRLIAEFMIWINYLYRQPIMAITKEVLLSTLVIFSPVVPFFADELYERISGTRRIIFSDLFWPVPSRAVSRKSFFPFIIQLNGKTLKVIQVKFPLNRLSALKILFRTPGIISRIRCFTSCPTYIWIKNKPLVNIVCK